MIHEQNIEERIFEYHEGLLGATQKEELMAYLYDHPEWQRDFAIWAQSRLHPFQVEVPAFHSSMIKKGPVSLYWMKSYLFVAIITSLAIIWHFLPVKKQGVKKGTRILKEKGSKRIEKSLPSSSLPSPQKNIDAPFSNGTSFWKEGNEEKTISSDAKQMAAEKLKSWETDSTVHFSATDTSTYTPIPPVTNRVQVAEIPTKSTLEMDSIAPNLQQKSQEEKEKKKTKSRFSLRPTSDIVPTNSNF